MAAGHLQRGSGEGSRKSELTASRTEPRSADAALAAGASTSASNMISAVVARLAYQEARSIEATARTISLDELERAAAAIRQADRVIVVGFGSSA